MRGLLHWLLASVVGLLAMSQPPFLAAVPHSVVATTNPVPSGSGPGYPGPFSSG